LPWTAGKVVFDLNTQGVATGLTFHLGGEQRAAKKVD
jgi:hypothetical protein